MTAKLRFIEDGFEMTVYIGEARDLMDLRNVLSEAECFLDSLRAQDDIMDVTLLINDQPIQTLCV